MRQEEFEIVRALSAKLDDQTLFVLSYQYHTEKDPGDPEGKRNDRAKSRYRMLGRVMRIADMEALSKEMHQDANRMLPWKWPDDPSWDGVILYAKDASNECFSNWLRLKVKKAVPWETALQLFKGMKKDTEKGSPTYGQYVVFTPNAVYETEGYSCSDGSVVDITDREALLSKVGQNVWKEIRMKLVGPQNAKGGRQ